jgi:hypothetical protein
MHQDLAPGVGQLRPLNGWEGTTKGSRKTRSIPSTTRIMVECNLSSSLLTMTPMLRSP